MGQANRMSNVIPINKEYFILPQLVESKASRLRHNCSDIDLTKSEKRWLDSNMRGAIDLTDNVCIYCDKAVDRKVLFIYKLWQWHNA